jgi:hypothetical protein
MPEFVLLAPRQSLSDSFTPFVGYMLNQGQHVVDLKSSEHIGDALIREGLKNLGQEFRGEIRQHRSRSMLGKKEVDHRADFIRSQVGEKGAEIRRMNAREHPLCTVLDALLE